MLGVVWGALPVTSIDVLDRIASPDCGLGQYWPQAAGLVILLIWGGGGSVPLFGSFVPCCVLGPDLISAPALLAPAERCLRLLSAGFLAGPPTTVSARFVAACLLGARGEGLCALWRPSPRRLLLCSRLHGPWVSGSSRDLLGCPLPSCWAHVASVRLLGPPPTAAVFLQERFPT